MCEVESMLIFNIILQRKKPISRKIILKLNN